MGQLELQSHLTNLYFPHSVITHRASKKFEKIIVDANWILRSREMRCRYSVKMSEPMCQIQLKSWQRIFGCVENRFKTKKKKGWKENPLVNNHFPPIFLLFFFDKSVGTFRNRKALKAYKTFNTERSVMVFDFFSKYYLPSVKILSHVMAWGAYNILRHYSWYDRSNDT